MIWNLRSHYSLFCTIPTLTFLLLFTVLVSACSTSTSSGSAPIATPVIKGTITEFALQTSKLAPGSIIAGPDGNVWFTESANGQTGKIGRVTTTGKISELVLRKFDVSLFSITNGADHTLWFTKSDILGTKGMIGHLV